MTCFMSVHAHHHPEEAVWNVIEGEVLMTLGAETRIIRAGRAAVVPSDVEHSARANSDFRAIIVDFPPRAAVAGVSTGLLD